MLRHPAACAHDRDAAIADPGRSEDLMRSFLTALHSIPTAPPFDPYRYARICCTFASSARAAFEKGCDSFLFRPSRLITTRPIPISSFIAGTLIQQEAAVLLDDCLDLLCLLKLHTVCWRQGSKSAGIRSQVAKSSLRAERAYCSVCAGLFFSPSSFRLQQGSVRTCAIFSEVYVPAVAETPPETRSRAREAWRTTLRTACAQAILSRTNSRSCCSS